jgi:hypothetical protein
MKIVLDNSPVRLEIETPHGSLEIEVWPSGHTGGGSTQVTVKPNEAHSDQALRSDDGTRIILRSRKP